VKVQIHPRAAFHFKTHKEKALERSFENEADRLLLTHSYLMTHESETLLDGL